MKKLLSNSKTSFVMPEYCIPYLFGNNVGLMTIHEKAMVDSFLNANNLTEAIDIGDPFYSWSNDLTKRQGGTCYEVVFMTK